MSLSFSSLRSRLLLLVLVGALPGFILATYSIFTRFERAEEQALDQARLAIRIATRRNETEINRAREFVTSIAGHGANGTVSSACELLRQWPTMDSGIADDAGRILCRGAVDPEELIGPAAVKAIQEAASSNDVVIGDYETDRRTASSKLAVAQPFGFGAQRLVVFTLVGFDWFSSVAEDLRLAPGFSLVVFDGKRQVLARYPEPGRWVGTVLPDNPVTSVIGAGGLEGLTEARGIDGVRRLYANMPLRSGKQTDHLGVGIPVDAVFGPANRFVLQSVAVLMLAVVIALAGSRLVAGRYIIRKSRALMRAADRLSQGDLEARTGITGGDDEMTQLARVFDAMADTIHRKEAQLISANSVLETQHQKLQVLSRELIRVQESERKNVARELHDEVGQNLTALKINLQIMASSQPVEMPQVKESIGIIERMLTGVRNLSLSLRPPMLDEAGFNLALRWHLETQSERAGLHVDFDSRIDDSRLPNEIGVALFRIVQESFTNILRHAAARNVWITLTDASTGIELTVRDDGKGFDVEAFRSVSRKGRSLGIIGMQERTALLGGDFAIQSVPGSGTTLSVSIPLQPPGLAPA